jgi:glutamate-1-semialdehyde 2,1-aminomutase
MIQNHPYARSEELLARALKTIPLGTQTFSKSITQYPLGVSPYYITKGEGSRVWDADGNEYVDFINGLLAVLLGYRDPDVTTAVEAQLEDGVLFTLPHPIEIEVAERIRDMMPSAEMVRFAKNGSDVTAGAIRLARAQTGRDHVAVCGYHGWQDWYIGSTSRDRGVPKAVRDLTHTFMYNDLDSLAVLFKERHGEVAAVILEPMNVVEPEAGFLEGVRDLATSNGALLVFDEMITGFRFARGGAQELFGITPDLSTLGKGLANGYPLSAITGRADVMKLMEEVFFSFTMGGETLSLAAALATLNKIDQEPVIENIHIQGRKVIDGVKDLISRHGLGEMLSISGHPAWSFLNFKDAGPYSLWQIKTLYMQEILTRGVLTYGTHNMSYAHSDGDVARLLDVYDQVFPILRDAVENKTLEEWLNCEPLAPLFQVR